MSAGHPISVEQVNASVRTLAFGVLLLCIAVMIDFNDLRRLDRRVGLRLTTLEDRHVRLVRAVDQVSDRLSPPASRAENARAAKRAAAGKPAPGEED